MSQTTSPVSELPGPPAGSADLADLFVAHDRQLRAFALRLLGDRGLVDDALQEAYLKAVRALPAFRGEASHATWLHRILHNVCMDELRRRRRRAESPYDESMTNAEAVDSGEFTVERADLDAGLADLAPDLRAAVVLVHGYGMDYAAAARTLGVPTGTVGSRVFRARAALRESLALRAG